MTTLEALIRLRDDLKEWVTNNLNAIGKPKATDVSIEPIEGLSAADAQGALEELTSKTTLVTDNSIISFDELSSKFNVKTSNPDFEVKYDDQNIYITVYLSTKEAISSSETDYVIGRITDDSKRPKFQQNSFGFSGTCIGVMRLDTDGYLKIRVLKDTFKNQYAMIFNYNYSLK